MLNSTELYKKKQLINKTKKTELNHENVLY